MDKRYESLSPIERVRLALQYSRSFVATWPLNTTSNEHITGLCDLIEDIVKFGGYEIDVSADGHHIAIRTKDGRKALLRHDRGLTYNDRIVFELLATLATRSQEDAE